MEGLEPSTPTLSGWYSNQLKYMNKFLGIKNHILRNSIRRERLSEFNKKYGLGSYYLYTDEQVIDDYRSHLMKQTKVL